MEWKIPLFKIYWDKEDIKLVDDAIRRGMYWAIGPNVEEFEKKLAAYIGAKYAVTFNSGTSALHAILFACGIGKGDDVIVPSFTFIATANAPLFVGARPVFADIEERTLGLDARDVEERITTKTKAILPIHYGGFPCLIEDLRKVAKKHNLLLIEDAAESLGAAINGKKVGTFGDAGMFSFCSNKIITTGEGGVVVTNRRQIYEKLKLVRSHGRAETANYFSSVECMDYIALGYNFRMSDIAAALGIAQLNKVDKIIKMRSKKAERLTAGLSRIPEIEVPPASDGYVNVYQMYTIRIKDGQKRRDTLLKYLAERGVMSKVYFSPVHLTHFYKNRLKFKCQLPVTEKMYGQVLSLPLYPSLTDDEITYISNLIKEFFL